MSAFTIEPLGPFSWDLALDMLGGFPPTAHHEVGPLARLAFPLDGTFEPAAVALRWEGDALRGELAGDADPDVVKAQVARIFSLDIDGRGYRQVGERDPVVGRLQAARAGQRPVLFTSPYECAAWAVISQRINRAQAARIKDRLIDALGTVLEVGGGRALCFPPPDRLAGLESFPGLPAVKVERLRGVARAALEGRLDAGRLTELGEEAPAEVKRIPGLGEFWARAVWCRACTAPDAFPGERQTLEVLAAVYGGGEPLSRERVREVTDRWRPYRMWVTVLLRLVAGRGGLPNMAAAGP